MNKSGDFLCFLSQCPLENSFQPWNWKAGGRSLGPPVSAALAEGQPRALTGLSDSCQALPARVLALQAAKEKPTNPSPRRVPGFGVLSQESSWVASKAQQLLPLNEVPQAAV